MTEIVFAVAKWLSQAMIVCSGIYGMFSDLYREDHATHRRTLTRAGWINLGTILIGFLLFGITEYHDHLQQQRDKLEQEAREREQQLRQKAALDQRTLQINMLRSNVTYLKRLILMEQSVSEWQVSWTPSQASLARMRAVEIPAGSDAYFKPCLLYGETRATPTDSQHWILRCLLNRPQGYVSPTYDLPPEDARWKAFEKVLDVVLSPYFSVSAENGTEVLLRNHVSRPKEVVISRWNVSVSGFDTKLSSFDNAQFVFRWDADSANPDLNAKELPENLQIRSFDPNLKLNEKIRLHWSRKQSGSYTYEDPDTGEQQKRPLFSSLSGPHVLKATLAADVFPELPLPPENAQKSADPATK